MLLGDIFRVKYNVPVLNADGEADSLHVGHTARRRAALCMCHLQPVESRAARKGEFDES